MHQLGALVACVAVFVYTFLRRHRRLSTIKDVPGPENPSWIFGMSRMTDLTSFTSFRTSPVVLNVETFKDTSGISRPGKLEQRIKDSSRISGISLVGTVPLGYVPPLIKHPSVYCIRAPD